MTTAPPGTPAATAARRPLPVLMYHAIGTPMPPGQEWLSVPPAVLAEQLATLADAGYALLGLEAALAAGPDRRVVALTFDDAYTDFAESAMTVLGEHRAGATLYVPTGHLGGPADWLPGGGADQPLMDRAAVAEVARAGVEIGSHAARHVPLDVLPRVEVAASLRDSRAQLQDLTDRPVSTLAYPHGYESRRLRRDVAAAGYTHACRIGHRLHPADEHPLAVSRLAIGPGHRGRRLLDEVAAGPPPWVPAMKRAAAPGWRAARRAARWRGRTWT